MFKEMAMAQDYTEQSVPRTNATLSPYSLDPSYLPKGPEFIFPVDVHKKSWNEKMFERTGTCYMIGLLIGGGWGIAEGLRRPEGKTTRLRMNSILNGCTRRGPFLGNTGAVLALMYSPMESCLAHYRGKEDNLNSIGAAAATGLLYKSTAGVRAMGLSAIVGCTVVGAYIVTSHFFGRQRIMFS